MARSAKQKPLFNGREKLVGREAFFDQSVYQMELENVFTRCWLLLAHESQLPRPGDYVTSYMGEDPIIVWHGPDGKIRAFLNSCRHRGMRVCRTDMGNAKVFSCPFHGWSYSSAGNLVGVPFEKDVYPDRFSKENFGLVEVAKVASYGGFIFGCWDAGADSLDHYLGDFRWYFDILIERALGGLEFIKGNQRYRLTANWKLAGENFTGDTYHLPHSHGSVFRLPIRQINPLNPIVYGRPVTPYNISFKEGHGLCGIVLTGERYETDLKIAADLGNDVVDYVKQLRERLVQRLIKQQTETYALAFGNIFPNFSINDFSALRPTGIYVWHPKAPGNLEAWNFCAIDRDAPQILKDMIRVDFTRTQAASGVAAQDDGENFEQVTMATRGVVGRRLDFIYQMGPKEPMEKKGYPGSFAPYYSENNQVAFYRRWAELMGEVV